MARKKKSKKNKKTKQKKPCWLARVWNYLFNRKAVKKIYATTDGYFNNKPRQKKPRYVAVVDQRDDGAVAVVKIYSKGDKEQKGTNAYIKDLTLSPNEHTVLKEDSIVGNQFIIGVKQTDGSFKPIHTRDFNATNDKLTTQEHKKIKENVQNDTIQHRSTHKRKMEKWHSHFK